MRRPGVIFDFDGTIALSEHVHQQAWVDLCQEWELTLPGDFLENAVGATDESLSNELATGLWRGRDEAEILLKKRRYYQKRCGTESLLVPGIDRLLKRLHGELPIGLATSASIDDITPTIKAYELGKFFDVVLTIESIKNPKPDPEIYLAVAQKLGIAPEATFVFEDSPVGTMAARAAGMKVIGMTTTFGIERIGPVMAELDDYQDLSAIERLLNLKSRS